MREVIIKSRLDLNNHNADKIIAANSPFEGFPENKTQFNTNNGKYRRGILLIHGLFDSPFRLMDIGKHLLAQGYVVYSILLPGHGTVPGDILNIHNKEWLKAVAFGIKHLAQTVESVYLAGFSLGGTLAIYQALQNPTIKGLLLFSPALKPHSLWNYLIYGYPLISTFYPQANWYRINKLISYATYTSYACNGPVQAINVMHKLPFLQKEYPLEMPLFIVTSAADETVSASAVIDFFKAQNNPQNRLIFYSSQPISFQDKRIEVRSSVFPKEKILDFSHTCIPIAPDNPHFGRNGDFKDFLYYPNNACPPNKTDIYRGAINQKNLSRHCIQRISYNPDFDHMMGRVDEFLADKP